LEIDKINNLKMLILNGFEVVFYLGYNRTPFIKRIRQLRYEYRQRSFVRQWMRYYLRSFFCGVQNQQEVACPNVLSNDGVDQNWNKVVLADHSTDHCDFIIFSWVVTLKGLMKDLLGYQSNVLKNKQKQLLI
jgi:hypothetical protein